MGNFSGKTNYNKESNEKAENKISE